MSEADFKGTCLSDVLMFMTVCVPANDRVCVCVYTLSVLDSHSFSTVSDTLHLCLTGSRRGARPDSSSDQCLRSAHTDSY